jgi:hypothetical protein
VLEHINCSFIILIPKKESVHTPSDFSPISLQNYLMKAISKVLTNFL